MNRSFRGSSIGLLSGAIASTAFLATLHDGLFLAMETVKVKLPSELLRAANLDQRVSQEAVRLLALELDREDTVSLGRAAELCQTPLAAFMDFAVKHRVPHSGTALRTSNKNPRLLTVSNPGRRNWSPLSC
jgi:predicted HTH domain antitoxin